MRLRLAAMAILISTCLGASASDWKTLHTDPTREEKAAKGPTNHKTAPDVVRIDAVQAGGNRILWRVSFAQPFVSEDTLLILYLDVDNNERTGRTGYPVAGTDRMLTFANGDPGSSSHGSAGIGRNTIARVEDGDVVFQDDLALLASLILKASKDRPFDYHCRARVLCHRVSDGTDQDDTGWFNVSLPMDPGKPRPGCEASTSSSPVRDLRIWREGDALEIRFTTPEPMLVEINGEGSVTSRWAHGLSRNHGWTIQADDVKPARFSISLSDDLGHRLDTVTLVSPPDRPGPVQEPQKRQAVRLSVTGGVGRGEATRFPVAGGLPFPRGELFSPERARLVDGQGIERPSQVRVLSRWPDGSVKWLLVELIAVLPGDTSAGLALEYGSEVTRRARPAGEFPRVDLASLWRETLAWDGGSGASAPAGPWKLEQDGPIHRVYATSGRYSAGHLVSPFSRQVRVHTYRGIPWARVEHALSVEDGDPMAWLKSLSLEFGGPVAVRNYEENWPKAIRYPVSPECEPEGECIEGRRLFGRASICSASYSALDGRRPEGASATCLDLFPELKPDEYAGRAEPAEMLYYWFDNGFYKLRRGVRKTHEIICRAPAEDLAPLRQWLDNPAVLSAEPERVCASGVAGPLVPAAQQAIPEYEKRTASGFDAIEKRQSGLKEYGFPNFGDWYGERGRNWGNGEYDLAHALWLHWLRTGDYRFFLRAEQAASHMADIDIVHSDPDAVNVGRMWTHAMGHTGGYYPDGSFGMETFATRGYWDTGHTWTEGLLHSYLSTGNRRFLENALLVADQLARHATVDFSMATERQGGWPLIALVAVYEATGEAYYLNAARIIARETMRRQDPSRGGWFHRIGECKHQPSHYGGKTFMAGVLSTGLARLHRCLPLETHEDRVLRRAVETSLLRGCDWIVNEAWMENLSGFFYAQCPTFYERACTAGPWMVCEPLAYAWRISGNARYRDIAARSMEQMMKGAPAGVGKYLAMEMRSTPHFLALLSGR